MVSRGADASCESAMFYKCCGNASHGKSISTKEFNNLHAKYGVVPWVDMCMRVKNENVIEWYCTVSVGCVHACVDLLNSS